jgi:hypothetical protein
LLREGETAVLVLVGDDWAEDDHDVELMAADGRPLARARLPRARPGTARLHAMIGEHAGPDDDDAEVRVGSRPAGACG